MFLWYLEGVKGCHLWCLAPRFKKISLANTLPKMKLFISQKF